jgi:putative Ca2+/H+ antiporter (TMEM165/GDT1 family)
VDLAVVLTTFVVIFPAELPDKSLFASLVLGTRFRPLPVFFGAAAAFAVHVVIAVTIGGVFALAAFGVVFLGEWGDITQITTANLTARCHDPLSVGTGALLALWSVTALALTVGALLAVGTLVEALRV